MKKIKTTKFKLADLIVSTFVRHALNDDHVLYLAGLIEAGVKLDPIIITANGEVVDGRHRKEAYALLNIEEIEVDIYTFDNEIERISLAFKSNLGGALPPTHKDMVHTVRLLLDKRVPQKGIAGIIGLPPSLCDKLLIKIKRDDRNVRLNKATRMVLDDEVGVTQAAEVFNVKVEDLKARLGGGKNKKTSTVGELLMEITSRHRSHGQKNAHALKRALDLLVDGEISRSDALKIVETIEKYLTNGMRSLKDWRERIKQKDDNGDGDAIAA